MFRCIFSLLGTVHSLPILCAVLDKAAAQNTRMCAQDLKISLLKNKEINNIIYLCTSCLVALAILWPSAVRRKKVSRSGAKGDRSGKSWEWGKDTGMILVLRHDGFNSANGIHCTYWLHKLCDLASCVRND